MRSRITRLLAALTACAALGLVGASSASAGAFWFCGGWYNAGAMCTTPNAHYLNGTYAKAQRGDGSINYGSLVCAGIGDRNDNYGTEKDAWQCGWGEIFNPLDGGAAPLGYPKAWLYTGESAYINALAYTP